MNGEYNIRKYFGMKLQFIDSTVYIVWHRGAIVVNNVRKWRLNVAFIEKDTSASKRNRLFLWLSFI